MKKRILLIAVFILGIIIIPVIVDWCIIGNEFPSNVSNEDWIAFLGGYIGGIFTLAGVLLTLHYYRTQEKRMNDDNCRKQVASLYWFLRFKIHTIVAWHKLLEEATAKGEISIPHGRLIYNEEQLFLFEKMQYVQECLTPTDVKELMELYNLFVNIDTMYIDAFDEFMNREKENLSRRTHYRDSLYQMSCAVEEKLNGNMKDIILKIEAYIRINKDESVFSLSNND